MKKKIFLLPSVTVFIFYYAILMTSLHAQPVQDPDDIFGRPAEEAPEGFLAQAGNTGAPDVPESGAQPNQPPAAGPPQRQLPGFADTPWNTTFSAVQQKFLDLAASETSSEKVEILRAERNRFILVKRNDVIYRYSFYKTPFNVQKLTNHDLTQEAFDEEEGILFHVKITPIFIAAGRIEERLESLYGKKTKSTVDKKTQEGANIWELEGGLIFQWSEPYNGNPYTRTMDYLSTEAAERILKDQEDYFDSKEKKILQQIIFR